MLDKWIYCCNQNLSYQKSFASAKTLKEDQDYIMGHPFNMYASISMYTEVLF